MIMCLTPQKTTTSHKHYITQTTALCALTCFLLNLEEVGILVFCLLSDKNRWLHPKEIPTTKKYKYKYILLKLPTCKIYLRKSKEVFSII